MSDGLGGSQDNLCTRYWKNVDLMYPIAKQFEFTLPSFELFCGAEKLEKNDIFVAQCDA